MFVNSQKKQHKIEKNVIHNDKQQHPNVLPKIEILNL